MMLVVTSLPTRGWHSSGCKQGVKAAYHGESEKGFEANSILGYSARL